jgi:hypothetical protein
MALGRVSAHAGAIIWKPARQGAVLGLAALSAAQQNQPYG